VREICPAREIVQTMVQEAAALLSYLTMKIKDRETATMGLHKFSL